MQREKILMEAGMRIEADQKVHLYLRKLGYSDQEIDHLNMDTRMFHDLGLYGDDAADAFWLLQNKFGVDLSSFDIDRYFPPEFEGKTKFEAFLRNIATPQATRLLRVRDSYEPLTLDMINRSITNGRWILP